MSVKIALCMIVKGTKDEAEHLRTCLENVAPHVDGIFLNVNVRPGKKPAKEIMKVAEGYAGDGQLLTTEWHDNFAEARNANFAQVPKEYTHIIWLDCDDTVDKPEKIRKVCEVSLHDAIYADYLYDQDEEGNPTTVHMVARILKNNGSHIWKGSIHETLVETRSVFQGMTKELTVIHHTDERRKDASLLRNADLLEKQIKGEQDNPDPRTFYYLGCTYVDLGQIEGAKQLLSDYLTMSGWDQERGAAETKLGRVFLEEGNHAEAKKHFMLAIGEDPENPEPRIEMGSLELEMKSYGKARRWLEGVEAMEKNATTLERNPLGYTFRTYLLLADVYLSLGGKWLDKALEYAKKASKYKKKDKRVKSYAKMIESVVADKHLTEGVVDLVKALKKNKEDDKIKLLANAVPKQLEDNPIIVRLREPEPFTWPNKSIAIMCGSGVIEEWGPWSLKEGIGGSEEAVIRLSKHLADRGYKVTVFASVGSNAGVHEGVMWRNHWECNLDDNFDIFIAWRAPFLFDKKINARKAYLWLHDVMPEGEFTPERIANFDKCIVLSKYHRSLFPMIPDEKIMLSANGIDPAEFEEHDAPPKHKCIPYAHQECGQYMHNEVKRDPHRMIYTSSHVRGLAYLYRIWPDIKKAVPDATLDVYYGRGSYDTVHRGNPERMKWMDGMIAKAKELDGVTDHGKVGQDEIVRHIFESGIWVYPCPFPEISCITAMKMQAGGAVPVASNYAALEETIQFGHKQDFEEFSGGDLQKYKEALIWWLTHPKKQEKVRPTMMSWAREHYDWESVARQWVEGFEG
jgi:glycosyltransferase involved in cell wall biosynthesis